MKINFEQPLKNFKGENLKVTKQEGIKIVETDEDIKLSTVCVNALSAAYEDERNLNADEKMKRYKLALKIVDGKEVNLNVDELSLIKKLIGKNPNPLIVGRIFDIIDSILETT